MAKNIFEFIKAEESAYMMPITVVEGWEWSMKEHIRLSTLYKNSQFSTGNDTTNRDDKPFKNIVRPLLNLQYRAEGFDVKDIILYINDEIDYYKSYLIKKYHDQWARKEEIDTFIDQMVESYIDFGGALIREPAKMKPVVEPLASIAFCDQTNMLSGPIGFHHFYSPDELQDFATKGWGDPKNGATITIDDLIVLAQPYQVPDSQTGHQIKTPGKYAKVYEVHGMMPESWLPGGRGNPDKYARQMQIVGYYKTKEGKEEGVVLFAGREREQIFHVLKRDPIPGRALGMGGVEELFDAQVWTNYNEIVIKGMLDAASKVLIKTTDPGLKARHPGGLKDMDNWEIVEIEDGKDAGAMSLPVTNIGLFESASSLWNAHAKDLASATGATAGVSQGQGRVSFNALALLTQQGLALHDYRKGKIATFTGTMYRNYIIPGLVRDITSGKKFIAELSLEEMQMVADSLVIRQSNDVIKEKILNGEEINPADIENVKTQIRAQFMKKGSKHFLEIFKGEMKDANIDVEVSIADKQKDLTKMVKEYTQIISQIVAAPQILQDPTLAKALNQMIEAMGFSPLDFGSTDAKPQAPAPGPQNTNPAPQQVIPRPNPAPVQR